MNRSALKKSYVMYSNGDSVQSISDAIYQLYDIKVNTKFFFKTFGPRKLKNHFSKREHALIKKLYESCRNTDKIVDYLNMRLSKPITRTNLGMIAKRHGYTKMVRKKNANSFLTVTQEKELLLKYREGASSYQLMREYGFQTGKSVTDILKKNGIDPWSVYTSRVVENTPHVNFSMQSVDTPFKAYFLGLMATDGWVSEQRKSVSLSLVDEDCISFVSQQIPCSYSSHSAKKDTHKKFYKIFLRNERLYNELLALGVTPRKSKTLRVFIDQIPHELIPYFIRGAVDGDGWIRKDGGEFFICSASKSFLESLIQPLSSHGMVSLRVKEKDPGFYVLRSGVKSNMTVLKTFYAEPFGMNRKRDLLITE